MLSLVSNGQAAVEAALDHSFDLVLLDLQMPVMDGVEAAEKIRQMTRQSGRSLQIVALTAHALQEFQEKFSSYFDSYLCKPICLKKLDGVLASSAADAKFSGNKQPLP